MAKVRETLILQDKSAEKLAEKIDEHINDNNKKWRLHGGLSMCRENRGFRYAALVTRIYKATDNN